MGITTFADSQLWIYGTEEIDFSTEQTALADFEALSGGVEIEGINNLGEIGPTDNIVSFSLVKKRFSKKAKGESNAGDPVLLVGRLSDDPGQVRLRAAQKTKNYYNFKLIAADAESENETDTVIYFRALVGSATKGFGGNEDFMTEAYTLAIYPEPIVDEGATFSPTSP